MNNLHQITPQENTTFLIPFYDINMNIYDIIELVKLTEQRGQELLIDSLIIGIEIGRSNLTMREISELALQLKNLKILIDSNVCSPFKRDEIFDNYLN